MKRVSGYAERTSLSPTIYTDNKYMKREENVCCVRLLKALMPETGKRWPTG